MTHLGVQDFSGWNTDVGTQATMGGKPAMIGTGTANAAIISRPDTSLIDFFFTTAVKSGQTSFVAIVATNATVFIAGESLLQGNQQIQFFSYAPGPEPASFLLFGTVLVIAGLVFRRRFSSKS